MKINKIVGLSLAIMLGFGVVGCGDTEIEEEQQVQQEEQYQEEENNADYYYKEEQPKDEDVSDYYIENKQKANLEVAKAEIESVFNKNGVYVEVSIDEENNLVIMNNFLSINEIAQGITDGTWEELINNTKSATENLHYQYDVNVGSVITSTDNGKVYLSILNGTVIYNVENELN